MTDKSFDLSDIATGEKVFIVFTGVPKVIPLEGNEVEREKQALLDKIRAYYTGA